MEREPSRDVGGLCQGRIEPHGCLIVEQRKRDRGGCETERLWRPRQFAGRYDSAWMRHGVHNGAEYRLTCTHRISKGGRQHFSILAANQREEIDAGRRGLRALPCAFTRLLGLDGGEDVALYRLAR